MFKNREIKLGKIFDIQIALDYSWFWIFFIILYVFSAQILPAFSPFEPLWRYIIFGLFSSILFFGSVLAHELAHSLVARRQGEEINKITLFIFGGVANLEEEPDSAVNEIKMAFVGPATSFLLGLILIVFANFLDDSGMNNLFIASLASLGFINFALAVFNLLPGFPLDGGRILRGIIWYFNDNLIRATKIAVFAGKLVAVFLIIYGLYEVIFLGVISGLWLVFISLFLYQSADRSLARTLAKQRLSGITVSDLLVGRPTKVSLEDTVSALAKILKMRRKTQALVENEKGDIVGVVGAEDIRRCPNQERGKKVEKISQDINKFKSVKPDEKAYEVIKKLLKAGRDCFLVKEDDQIVDILSLVDIRFYFQRQKTSDKQKKVV